MNKFEQNKKYFDRLMDKVPFIVAFSEEQFKKGCLKMNWNEPKELIYIGHMIMKKSEYWKMQKAFYKSNLSVNRLLAKNTGLYEAFKYELSNCEYCYSYNPEGDLKQIFKRLKINQENFMQSKKAVILKKALRYHFRRAWL